MTKETFTGRDPVSILERLQALRESDAPTHGGRVLAYVYDSGRAELDELADDAARLARPLNGLDPTTFPSIAAMERDLIAFMRKALHGDTRTLGGRIVGSVTSGGTESCLLAVKTARDIWRSAAPGRDAQRPRLLAPTTVHAAFHKAAELFGLALDLVPCDPDGTVRASNLIERMADDVALVVVSAPAYPSGSIDPIAEVSAAALAKGISCHVDACFGGLALPWWPATPSWDFRLPGVTSISADLHKFGYAPKGVSVLLHRGRARHRKQFFALTGWPGYPVVTSTLLGSRSASPLAASWAIVHYLGARGYQELTAAMARVAAQLQADVATIPGLAVLGTPIGPSISLIADPSLPPQQQVDPHHLADELAVRGFKIQAQPGLRQRNGVRLPHTAHLTITPIHERVYPEFLAALRDAAAQVRGRARATSTVPLLALRMLGYSERRAPGSAAAWTMLKLAGVAPRAGTANITGRLAPLMALLEDAPAAVAEALLVELIARISEP